MKDMKSLDEYMRSRGVSDEMVAEARAELEAYIDAYNLAQTRKSRALTQREVAAHGRVPEARLGAGTRRARFHAARHTPPLCREHLREACRHRRVPRQDDSVGEVIRRSLSAVMQA